MSEKMEKKDVVVMESLFPGVVVIKIPPDIRKYCDEPTESIVLRKGQARVVSKRLWNWVKGNTRFLEDGMLYSADDEDYDYVLTPDMIEKYKKMRYSTFVKRIRNLKSEKQFFILSDACSEDKQKVNEINFCISLLRNNMPLDIDSIGVNVLRSYWDTGWGNFDEVVNSLGDREDITRVIARQIIMRKNGIRVRGGGE